MTATRIIEEDRGTCTRSPHPHNGYYAGDFMSSVTRPGKPTAAMSVMNDTRHSPHQVFA
jgi:hypothetical protein